MARIIGKGYSYSDVLMVPKYNKVRSRTQVNFKTKVTRNYEIDIPFLAANMDTVCESKMAIEIGKLGGLGIIHQFMTIEQEAEEIRKVKSEGLIAAAAIGIKDVKERSKALVEAGVNILVIDLAHGHSKYAGKTLDYLKETYPQIDVMAGNVATKDAAEYFLSKGADAIKVGVGPGTMCTTRIMTGAGIPQLTAIMDVYEAVKNEIPICADGGLKKPGDIVKAIGAGASTIMSGFLFSGTEESPGEIIEKENKKYKLYRGSASFEASVKKAQLHGENDKKIISVEGEKTLIPYKGPIKPIIDSFLGGLASGMTYMGADKMIKLIGKADFVEISDAGFEESRANGVNKTQ
ncbi:guanosine monophosphate reductase [Candidatus Pacearchaeota archaeon]|nr:guanosine monophosphate reductase [Candidatus Pacearchaeota archaeon]